MDDLYRVLEAEPDTPQEQLEKVHRALVRRYHPDGHPPARRAWAEERMKQINGAWAVLGDERKRARYDAERLRGVSGSAPTAPTAPPREAARRDPNECAGHPGRARTSVCLHCRGNVCDECLQMHQGLPYCPQCSPTGPTRRRPRAQPRPRRTRESGDGALASNWIVIAFSALLGMATLGPYLYAGIGLAFIRDPGSELICVLGSLSLAAFCMYAFVLSGGRGFERWFERAPPARMVGLFLAILAVEIGGVAALALALPRIEKNVAAQALVDRHRLDERSAAQALAGFYGCWRSKKNLGEQVQDWGRQAQDKILQHAEPDDPTTEPDLPNAHTIAFEKLASQRLPEATQFAEAYLRTEKSREKEAAKDRAACLAYLVWLARTTPGQPDRREAARECRRLSTHPYFEKICQEYLTPNVPADPTKP